MNWIKAIPFVGTAVSAGECIVAAVNGNMKEAGCKLLETCFDAAMDVTVVASGGLASLVTAPGKIAGKQAAKVAVSATVKAVAGRAFTGVVADSFANKKSRKRYGNSYRTSSGSNSAKQDTNNTGDDDEQYSEEERSEDEHSDEESSEEESSKEEDSDSDTPDQETIAEIFGDRNAEIFPGNRYGSDQEQPGQNAHYRHYEDDESSSEINSYRLNDNCYYTTLAGILNTSVRRLIDRTGFLQNRGGAQIPEILDLYKAADLPIHSIREFSNLNELYTHLDMQLDIGETPVVFPFGYSMPEIQMGHMVALYVRRNPWTQRIEARIVDYQRSKRDPERHFVLNDQMAAPYYLFDIRRR